MKRECISFCPLSCRPRANEQGLVNKLLMPGTLESYWTQCETIKDCNNDVKSLTATNVYWRCCDHTFLVVRCDQGRLSSFFWPEKLLSILSQGCLSCFSLPFCELHNLLLKNSFSTLVIHFWLLMLQPTILVGILLGFYWSAVCSR